MYNYMLTKKLAVNTPQTNRQETQKCRRDPKKQHYPRIK